MELFRGFVNNKHNHGHDHSHDHSHGYHHHHHSNGGTNGNPNNHLHHSNSVEQNLALSSNNPTGGIRKKSGSLIMEMSMQNPGYSAELNAEKRQDSIEKQIDGIHVDFGLEEMMTSV